jgi:glycosyltransferase involved in cell wall biosynthesis
MLQVDFISKPYLHIKPEKLKTLLFAVTNDLSFDQRMIRICGSLSKEGYRVKLVGRKLKDSLPLSQTGYEQKRLHCFFNKGKAFYIEFNIRLFFWMIFQKMDLVCAIDLDTILPCYCISVIKGIPRVYDAHELFCEMKEVVTRPQIYRIWKAIERFAVPRFPIGYTVNQPIADILKNDYGVSYSVIRNIGRIRSNPAGIKKEKIILYQGAVNEGRYFENLIPAMKWVEAPLHIYGDGNFLEKTRELIRNNGLESKVFLMGKINPGELSRITASAWIGITLFENTGQSNYLSLANRFFDYMQSGLPQLCSNYPCYRELNDKYGFALLIEDHSPINIARQLNNLLENEVLYKALWENCLSASTKLNWENEEIALLGFYKKILY